MERNLDKLPINCIIDVRHIMSIHYFEFKSDFCYDGEHHDFWELVYVDRGTAEITAEDRKTVLNQGEIIFHKPGEFHALASTPDDPPTVFIITFCCSSAQMKFFAQKHMNVPTPLRRYITEMIADGQEAYLLDDDSPYAGNLQKKKDGLIGSEQLIKNNLEMFLIKLIRFSTLPKLEDRKEEVKDPLTAKIIEILTNNVYGRITVDAIAKDLGFSRTHIAATFKRNCGKTITEYLTDLKISEAKYLIRKGQYTISQISYFLCYDNPHYFCRVFKKETNLTPKQYSNSVSYPDKYAKST